MTTFQDLKFHTKKERTGPVTIQALIDFPNGYGASVARGLIATGGTKDYMSLLSLRAEAFVMIPLLPVTSRATYRRTKLLPF